jgi:hypothetical protein
LGLFELVTLLGHNADDDAGSGRSSVVYLFRTAIHLLSFQSLGGIAAIALPSLRDLLSCGSASLASQDLKIEIISAP